MVGGGVGVAVVAGLLTWALWPEPPRQREYLDATACLLTDEQGVTADPARTVWTTMQIASVKSLVRVQNLQVNGPQTTENAAAQIEAVTKAASAHGEIRFLTVGGGTAADNVRVLDPGATEALQTTIREHLDALADNAE
jgi:hypothetical protein